MWKYVYRGFSILVGFIVLTGAPSVLDAINPFLLQLQACESIEECDAEADRLYRDKKRLQDQLAEARAQQDDINEEIFLLVDQIKLADEELQMLQDSINQLAKEIERLQDVIKRKEADVKQLLVQQQKEVNTNMYLTMLLSANSISDFLVKMNAIETINGAKQQYITELQKDKQKLEESKKKLDESKAKVEANKAEKQQLMADRERKLAQLNAIAERVHGQIEDIQLSEDEINRQREILGGGVPSSRGWYLPSKTGSLTCWIGCYYDHLGNDFGMRVGTPVYAIANGVVVYTQYSTSSTGYGTMITIAHNINGVEHISIYGHLSVLQTSPGAIVRGGEQIGLSGNTGASTGPHLHLEIVHSTNEFVGKGFRRSHLVDALNVLPKPPHGWYW